MKIKGVSDFVIKEKIEILPGVEVTINSMPFGFDEKLNTLFPSPNPPTKIVRDARGRPKVIPGTTKIETREDKEDPEFLRLQRLRTRQHAAFIFYHGTKLGGDISWDIPESSEDDPEFYNAVLKELEKSKIPIGAVYNATTKILEISQIGEKELSEAQKVFLDETESGEVNAR